MVDIFIPTYKRARKIGVLMENVKNSTNIINKVWFILERDDKESIDVAQKLGVNIIFDGGSYATAINTAFTKTNNERFFIGADDVVFHDGWLEAGMSRQEGVVVANDMHSQSVMKGEAGTFFLVKREYIETWGGCVDRQYPVLYPYKHNFTDTEFYETAKARGVLAYEPKMIVEHIHWIYNLSPNDETYEKGKKYFKEDEELYNNRREKWLH